jgi:hypothetical protein
MKKIERHDAEHLYADWIVEKGNPHYFIYQVIRQWEDWELIDQIEDCKFMTESFEIIEEE